MKKLVLLIFLTSLSFEAWGLEPIYSSWRGKAISGYDTVAYFKTGAATEGESRFSYEWKGATWLFSSLQNKNEFVKNPEEYAPQFGGYCAWAVSNNYTASSDPHAWYIHEDKLYLNFSKNVQKKWLKDVPGNITKANKNWPQLLNR